MDFIIGAAFIVLTVIPLYKMLPRFGINPLRPVVEARGVGTILLLWIISSRMDQVERR